MVYAAKDGLAIAQYNVGCCFLYGDGVDADACAAVKWFRRAAEAGDADAQFNLALCYRDGRGVEANEGAVREWLARAAASEAREAAVVRPPL